MDLPTGNAILFPCFRKLYFKLLSISPQLLSFLTMTQIDSLSYFDTYSFTCPLRRKSVPVYGLELLSNPHLDKFESYIEVLCEVGSSKWLIDVKGPANSIKMLMAS